MKRRTMYIFVICISLLVLTSFNVCAKTEKDGQNDVWHQKWTGSGYKWEAYTGSKTNIDIDDVSYSIDGGTVTVTMNTVGTMTPNTENVVYTMHLRSGESNYYMVMFTNGKGSVLGLGEYAGFVEELTNAISGNTFSTSFEIDDPSTDFDIIGFNVESTDIDEEHGDAWWDYAPNDEAPYYSSGDDDTGGDDTGGDDTGGGDNNGGAPNNGDDSPGFEFIALIAGLALLIFVFRKRK